MNHPAPPSADLWIHLGDGRADAGPVRSMLTRLAQEGDPLRVLITADRAEDLPAVDDLPLRVATIVLPSDDPAALRDLPQRCGAAILLWCGGNFRVWLLEQARAAGLAVLAVNATGQIATRRRGLLSRRPVLAPALFYRILARDGAAAMQLRRAGIPADRIDVTGPMEEEAQPLPHDPNELTVMAEAVNTRPVWHAAGVMPGEVAQMAEAHRAASRQGFRLLLLLTPRRAEDGQKAAAVLRKAGLRVGLRSNGDNPEEEIQAYVTDIPGEIGLWYRLSPLSFMGGTFAGPEAMPPMQAAILGSVVLNGPQTAPFAEHYARLETHGASRTVRSVQDLGLGLGTLIAPDRAAAMAEAGWQVLTRGAEVTNRMVDLLRDMLDRGRA
ncbi:MAG: 3-deoxy-D-manno-octulosonic-acid transferase [Rhodobacteraceae bacterium HLUCCA08]|nr:MAG: 3-deoxy-D-manno-octulosonic-acid transferase [Rhodobacteraceae bacterium HLUCCA08]